MKVQLKVKSDTLWSVPKFSFMQLQVDSNMLNTNLSTFQLDSEAVLKQVLQMSRYMGIGNITYEGQQKVSI